MYPVSNVMLQNIFAYMESRVPNSNNNKTNQYPIGQELIFGEELNSYVPIFGEEHRSIMESDPFYTVRNMATNLTRVIYGEPRLVHFIVGVYKDLVEARHANGFHGVRGLNMKGIITACLYIIILYEEKTRLSLDVLVRAANSIPGQSKVKVTEKMVNRYIKLVVDTLKGYKQSNTDSNNNNKNNNKTILKHVDEEIKRLSIKIQLPIKETRTIGTMVRAYPRDLLTNHMPRTVAAMAVFMHASRGKRLSNAFANKALLKELGITKPILEKMVKKIKNVSII